MAMFYEHLGHRQSMMLPFTNEKGKVPFHILLEKPEIVRERTHNTTRHILGQIVTSVALTHGFDVTNYFEETAASQKNEWRV